MTSLPSSDWEKRPEPWAWRSGPSLSSSHEVLRRAGGAIRRDLAVNLLAFCRLLRRNIPNVTAGRVIDACRSLACIDVSYEEDFHTALQANLVSSQEDIPVFEALYRAFWQPWAEGSGSPWTAGDGERAEEIALDIPLPDSLEQQIAELLDAESLDGEQRDSRSPDDNLLAYSRTEVLTHKNFEDFTADDMREMRRLLRRLSPKLATALSRRSRAGFHGPEVDLRRSFRHSLRYGGEIVRLARKRRKVRKLRISLICDVSGSMDRYSRFLLQFVYGLENEVTGVDAWVFSTRLTEVTALLRRRSYGQSLAEIAESVHDWSGGTAIGECLWQFAGGAGGRRVNRRTVVIIISDGWDRGDVSQMTRALRLLKQRAFKIIWLNPLLGSPNYQPLCAGIRAALPFTDYFLPAHNLDSLLRLTRRLSVLGNEV